jgi:GTPase
LSVNSTDKRSKSSKEVDAPRMRAAVIVPVIRRGRIAVLSAPEGATRSIQARLEEAVGLALAIDLDIAFSDAVNLSEPKPATLFGSGLVEQLGERAKENGVGLVIVDHSLTPVQQRNLEKAWGAKVIDRTGLILEIFGRRAKTKEGVLQVELAHLNYQKGRLVRSWTHLERQRGGGGFMGGPGETQIETDRRLLQDRIDRLKSELEQVTRTRKLHRAKRQKVPYPVIAMAGYTNAGKSTLFNKLTGAEVPAQDMLFATLDPTLRRLNLPHGGCCILSDTVGFISNLPTQLVAAFRATLEEVVEADLILHVRDISDTDTAAQASDVNKVFGELGIDGKHDKRVVEVWNKIDLVPDADRVERLRYLSGSSADPKNVVQVSAVTGEGLASLLELIEQRVADKSRSLRVTLGPSQLQNLGWIYDNAEVIKRTNKGDGGATFDLRMTAEAEARLREQLAKS